MPNKDERKYVPVPKRFEYCTVVRINFLSGLDLYQEYGQEGWEMISCFLFDGGWYYVFKRELEPDIDIAFSTMPR